MLQFRMAVTNKTFYETSTLYDGIQKFHELVKLFKLSKIVITGYSHIDQIFTMYKNTNAQKINLLFKR